MNRSCAAAFFSLSTLTLLISGCAQLGPKALSPTASPIELSAELTTQSPVNVNNGSRYQSFELELEANQVVAVKQLNELAGELSLLDEQKRLVHGPQASSLTLSPPKPGRYTLYLSGADDSTYGPFSLQMNTIHVRNDGEVKSGERLAGVLMSGECNCYTLVVENEALYSINMTSDQLDTHLKLVGNGLELENDDHGEGTNSQLDAYLKPGRYTLQTRALDDKPNGTYVLSVSERAIPQNLTLTNSGTLVPGSKITGLASASALSYRIHLARPAYIDLTMSSSEVDSYLSLKGAGTELEDDDGAGRGNDAQISHLLFAGTYDIKASSINNKAGLFELSYNLTPLNSGHLASLTPGQYVQGTLTANRTTYGMLRISQAGQYQLDLVANEFDAVSRLEGAEMEAEDDDGAGARDSRITVDLTEGDYRLQIRGVERDSRGPFILSVQRLN